MKVTLSIPDEIEFQYVYRMTVSEQFDAKWPDGFRFVSLQNGSEAMFWHKSLVRCFGRLGALKAIAKLMAGTRALYFVYYGADVMSYGWCNFGWCKYYKVEPDSTVIGPIWSDATIRGKGIATTAIQSAINGLMCRGKKLYYIDTSKSNFAAQRVFQKCGFGDPVALYLR